MKPGDSTTGTVDIANTGSVAGNFTLSTSNVGPTPTACSASSTSRSRTAASSAARPRRPARHDVVYNGKASAFTTAARSASFAATAKHRYQFTVTMPSTIANTFQGKTASVEFDWDAVTA